MAPPRPRLVGLLALMLIRRCSAAPSGLSATLAAASILRTGSVTYGPPATGPISWERAKCMLRGTASEKSASHTINTRMIFFFISIFFQFSASPQISRKLDKNKKRDALLAALALLPLYGPAVYLLLRPQLPNDDDRVT